VSNKFDSGVLRFDSGGYLVEGVELRIGILFGVWCALLDVAAH